MGVDGFGRLDLRWILDALRQSLHLIFKNKWIFLCSVWFCKNLRETFQSLSLNAGELCWDS